MEKKQTWKVKGEKHPTVTTISINIYNKVLAFA